MHLTKNLAYFQYRGSNYEKSEDEVQFLQL